MSGQPKTFLTEEQYLEIERQAEFKSEYFQGEMFAMAGAVEAHNLLVNRFSNLLYLRPDRGACRTYTNDMRVQVSETRLSTYPDVIVVCEEPQFLDKRRDNLLNPSLIVEVLSPSTEAYDRGRKFDQYKTIDSFKEYLLVSTDRIHVDLYTRQPFGRWLLTSADAVEDALDLQSIAFRLSLSELYAGIELAV